MTFHDSIIAVLAEWASELAIIAGVEGTFLFGSLVNQDGAHFDPVNSDVDLAVLLADNLNADERAALLAALKDKKVKLEVELMQLLGRGGNEQICSVVPMTLAEVAAGIHKGGSARIPHSTKMIDLNDREPVVSLLSAINRLPTTALPDTTSVLEFCQSARAKYLSVSANKNSAFKISDDLGLAAPKELLRNLSMAVSSPDTPSEEAVYLANGVGILNELLRDKRSTSDLRREIFTWSVARIGGRGVKQSISDFHYMVLVEDIFDLAIDRIGPAGTVSFAVPSAPRPQRRRH
ncbi:nucleotidyltransferase domain-containing protein [Rhizobium laguerreae]|uniref:nucleotidyltransferase domain-containing protein n=1 Tax=Rhizobium laguerreae TaxID=1076926 RepID=UPI001A8E2DB6|nr:nucleotidyltransferase domain-containing protein [Rhizobium laguerreae]MBN9981866.1 nucleotidyltransferase domain-containing protein [Rhizobium laguerreae]